jgi:hypothetical protein
MQDMTPVVERNRIAEIRSGEQIVNILTPNGLHADFAIPAARAGKHVLLEKPVEITLEREEYRIPAYYGSDYWCE